MIFNRSPRGYTLVIALLPCCASFGSDVSIDRIADKHKHIDLSQWELAWSDDFDYPDGVLDERWVSQNGPSGHILCSRWRENAAVVDGVLELRNKRERRGGQEWTSASLNTKRRFKYGYFECRYRYAEATGTNNSFWLMTTGAEPTPGKRFEIDINEGHYPNRVNTNIHNWSDVTIRSDGTKTHPSASRSFTFGVEPAYSVPLETPVRTSRIRLVSNHPEHFHIRDFRVYAPSDSYPARPANAQSDGALHNVVDHVQRKDLTVSCSGVFNETTRAEYATDGTQNTSWISNPDGRKWLQLAWRRPVEIGCLQFVNGWRSGDQWLGLIENYTLQWDDDGEWRDVVSVDSRARVDFGALYHVYGLLWTPDELVFYKDGQELRRERNEFCHSEAPIFLSEAIIGWAGEVSQEIDGTSMKVDWVRYYQRQPRQAP